MVVTTRSWWNTVDSLAVHTVGHKDFFIRNAIGWTLREYAYTDPDAVRAHLEAHRTILAPLSIREASRHL